MKFCLALLFALMLSLPAYAEPAAIPQDSVLRGRFTEDRTVPGFKAPLHSEGRFLVSPAEGILWMVEKPFVTTTIITPQGLTQQIDGAQAMDIPAKKIPFLTHLYEMIGGVLAGNWTVLEKDFSITRGPRKNPWQVSLTPKHTGDATMPITKITVRGTKFAERTIMTRNDNTTDTINFLDQKLSKLPLTDAEQSLFKSVQR